MTPSARFPAALLASGLVHLLVLAALVRYVPPAPARQGITMFPIGLVGGGGGGHAAPAPSGPQTPPIAPPDPVPEPVVHPRTLAARRPLTRPAAVASANPGPHDPAFDGAGGVGRGGGEGGGVGSGIGPGVGPGSGPARVAYDVNPKPPYPLVGRRLGMEGVVELSVLVAPDGRAAEVRIARSSGHEVLDESAATTVRAHWRFIPAQRDGVAVEDRVTVPIRFGLE